MNIKEFKNEDLDSLKKQLNLFYKDKFKLLLEKSSGAEFKKNHLIKKVNKDIAKFLTLITSMENKGI